MTTRVAFLGRRASLEIIKVDGEGPGQYVRRVGLEHGVMRRIPA